MSSIFCYSQRVVGWCEDGNDTYVKNAPEPAEESRNVIRTAR